MCGIVAAMDLQQQRVATSVYDALVQLQHRGQDAAGIISSSHKMHMHHGRGLVQDTFSESDIERLVGSVALGHVRYSTSGSSTDLDATQPFWVAAPYGIALAHNGNISNQDSLRRYLIEQRRHHLHSDSDSEILIHLFSDYLLSHEESADSEAFFTVLCEVMRKIMDQVQGAYSVVCSIVGKGLIAFRDPHGIRPLCIGQGKAQKDAYMFASETAPFFSLGLESIGDVLPGELVYIDQSAKMHRKIIKADSFHPCVFEYVYFSRPDAVLDDVSVYRARLRMGQNLAQSWQKHYPDLSPDVVIPVPFSANTAALSFANALGVRYSEGLYKNPFIGRTFIMPNGTMRKRSVRYKLSPQRTEIEDKKVLLVDDSIVRGTTSAEIVKVVRECGAKEVYFASTYPAVKYPCYYGIHIPTKEELIANQMPEADIARHLGVDALLYQEESALIEAVDRRGEQDFSDPCRACINGKYCAGTIEKQEE